MDNLEVEIPGLKTTVVKQFADERPSMVPFEMEKSAPIVKSVRKAFKSIRDYDQQIGLWHLIVFTARMPRTCRPSSDAGYRLWPWWAL